MAPLPQRGTTLSFSPKGSLPVAFLLSPSDQVSEELIRVAILWHEMWHEGLEEASRLYFGERNVKGMFEVLEPLHAMMERGPQTLKETSFNQVQGHSSPHQTASPLTFLLPLKVAPSRGHSIENCNPNTLCKRIVS